MDDQLTDIDIASIKKQLRNLSTYEDVYSNTAEDMDAVKAQYSGLDKIGKIGDKILEKARGNWDWLSQNARTPAQRLAIARALKGAPEVTAIPFLSDALDSPSFWVRSSAMQALQRIGGEQSKTALQRAYAATTDPDTRSFLEEALSTFSHEEIPEWALRNISSMDANERKSAVDSLASTPTSRATELLLDALNDKDNYVAAAAYEAILDRDDALIGLALIDRMQKPGSSAQLFAARALGARKEKRAVGPLLAMLLGHRNRKHRYTAAFSLGKIGDVGALPDLLQVVRNTEEDPSVVAATCVSLGKLGDPRAIQPLAEVIRAQANGSGQTKLIISGNLYTAAAEALCTFDDDDASSALMSCLAHAPLDTQVVIAKCLARRKHREALAPIQRALAHAKETGDYLDSSYVTGMERAINALEKL